MYLYPNGVKAVAKFLGHIEEQCEENNVALIYHPSDFIGPERCRGYFAEPEGGGEGELKVAVKNDISDWFPVLVHEYCHLLQWIDKEPTYKACTIGKEGDAGTFMDYWLEKQVDLDDDKRSEYFKKVREMELNNERRAVDIIKIWNLPINLNRYIRQASAYIYFYIAAEKFQCWYDPKANMFSDPELMATMPCDNLDGDYTEMSPAMEAVFAKWMVKKEEGKEEGDGRREETSGSSDSNENRGPGGTGDDRSVDPGSGDKDSHPDEELNLLNRDPGSQEVGNLNPGP